jgi:hypothetical protein
MACRGYLTDPIIIIQVYLVTDISSILIRILKNILYDTENTSEVTSSKKAIEHQLCTFSCFCTLIHPYTVLL